MSSTHGVEDAEESVDVPKPGAVGLRAYPGEGNPGEVGGRREAIRKLESLYLVVARSKVQPRRERTSGSMWREGSTATKSEYPSWKRWTTGENINRAAANTKSAPYGPHDNILGGAREDLAKSRVGEAPVESSAG